MNINALFVSILDPTCDKKDILIFNRGQTEFDKHESNFSWNVELGEF